MTTPASLPVKLVSSNIRPIAYRILSKKHGLNIQTDALAVLTDVISTRFGAEWRGPKAQQFIEDIAKAWKHQDRGLFIDGPGLLQVVKELSKEKSVERDEPRKATRSDTLMDIDLEEQSKKEEVIINWSDYFRFITPELQPRFEFDRVRKQFVPKPAIGGKLKSTLKASTELFNSRYYLLVDRLSRHENFQKSSFSSLAAINSTLNKDDVKYEITLIKNVLGRDGGRFILFGVLSKNINGNYVIEDSTDQIELDFTLTHATEGSFYTPGMVLIMEGIYSASGGSMSNDPNVISGKFHVSNVSHPPAERRDTTLKSYGYLDFMGIHQGAALSASGATGKIDKPLRKKLSALEKGLAGHKMIFLGANCFFDDKKIMSGLKKLFDILENTLIEQQGTEDQEIPLAIVMVGSFTSQPVTPVNGSSSLLSNSENYKSGFDDFAALLASYPVIIKTCKFVLVPGPNDPWQSSYSLGRGSLTALPQRPIPKVFVTRLERLLPKESLIYGGNPMRINYLSQELVLYRDDLMNKLKRNDIIFPEQLEELNLEADKENIDGEMQVKNIINDQGNYLSAKVKQARQLVKTILDQGNLLPFLKDLKIVDPNYLHALRIEPLPTSLVLFDSRFESFEVTYNGCKVVNIGNAISNKNNRTLNYVEYYPSTKNYVFQEQYF